MSGGVMYNILLAGIGGIGDRLLTDLDLAETGNDAEDEDEDGNDTADEEEEEENCDDEDDDPLLKNLLFILWRTMTTVCPLTLLPMVISLSGDKLLPVLTHTSTLE
jgi:hypothetical protein